MPNISRGRVATTWFETRHERGLTRQPKPSAPSRDPFHGITWTPARNQFLRENYSRMTGDQLAEHLNTTRPAIYRQANKLGLFRHAPTMLAAE